MESWSEWPLERGLYLFLGAAYLLVWIQLSLYHYKGGFHNKFMWGPVIYTPAPALAALLMGFAHGGWVSTLFVVLFVGAVLEGLAGVILHLRGIGQMVGGLTMRNFIAGPPVILAVTYTAIGAFGLLAHYWPQIGGSA